MEFLALALKLLENPTINFVMKFKISIEWDFVTKNASKWQIV